MKKFEIRLADQQRKNRAHLDNLERFFETERFKQLPFEQQCLMYDQATTMCRLDGILKSRMELLGLPVCD